MAIDAVQGPFATRELSDRLVVIMQSVGGLIGAWVELHIAQAVIAAIMAGIALRVWDGGSQAVNRLLITDGYRGVWQAEQPVKRE